MLKLFNRNTLVQVLVIIAATLLLWGRSILHPPAMVDDSAVLYHLLYLGLSSLPRLAVIIAIILILLEGLWLNLLLANIGLVSQNSMLPTLLYIIIISAPATTLSPFIFVGGISIAIAHQLMLRTTLLTISTDKICSATALISLASMFYFPALALLISYLLIVINYRLYSWRDWAALILGLAAPYIFLLTILYLSGNLAPWWSGSYYTPSTPTPLSDTARILSIGSNIFFLLLFLVSLISLWSHLSEHPVVWQKNTTTVLLLTLGSIAIIAIDSRFPVDMRLFALPFTLCSFHLFMPEKAFHSFNRRNRRTWLFDILLILTLIAAILC